jgi:hypothetical protein
LKFFTNQYVNATGAVPFAPPDGPAEGFLSGKFTCLPWLLAGPHDAQLKELEKLGPKLKGIGSDFPLQVS